MPLIPPMDPSLVTTGAEWSVPPVTATAPTGDAAQSGFGSALTKAIDSLQATQNEAAQGAQDLAAGRVDDPTSVVLAVERARLSMQLASTLRDKSVEAVHTIFSTQV